MDVLHVSARGCMRMGIYDSGLKSALLSSARRTISTPAMKLSSSAACDLAREFRQVARRISAYRFGRTAPPEQTNMRPQMLICGPFRKWLAIGGIRKRRPHSPAKIPFASFRPKHGFKRERRPAIAISDSMKFFLDSLHYALRKHIINRARIRRFLKSRSPFRVSCLPAYHFVPTDTLYNAFVAPIAYAWMQRTEEKNLTVSDSLLTDFLQARSDDLCGAGAYPLCRAAPAIHAPEEAYQGPTKPCA